MVCFQCLLITTQEHDCSASDPVLKVVISMQSFKRGMPLLPAYPDEHCLTEIDAGERFGLRRWVRYEPRSTKFQLAQYLPVFMERVLACPGAHRFCSMSGQYLSLCHASCPTMLSQLQAESMTWSLCQPSCKIEVWVSRLEPITAWTVTRFQKECICWCLSARVWTKSCVVSYTTNLAVARTSSPSSCWQKHVNLTSIVLLLILQECGDRMVGNRDGSKQSAWYNLSHFWKPRPEVGSLSVCGASCRLGADAFTFSRGRG